MYLILGIIGTVVTIYATIYGILFLIICLRGDGPAFLRDTASLFRDRFGAPKDEHGFTMNDDELKQWKEQERAREIYAQRARNQSRYYGRR